MVERNVWRFGTIDFTNVHDQVSIQKVLKSVYFEKITIKFKQINAHNNVSKAAVLNKALKPEVVDTISEKDAVGGRDGEGNNGG